MGAGLCDRADLQPDVVQCRSSGLDADGMPQWRCKADLDEGVKLGRISVTCEGYESPNDDYILKGSCGLEYELKKTRHFREDRSYNNRKGYYNEDKFDKKQQSSWVSSLIQLCIVLCVARCVYQACCGRSQRNNRNNQNNGPYPPPGDPAPQYPGHDSQQQQQYYHANSQTFQKQQPSTSSGLNTAATAAAAGGLGYMLGRRSAAPTRTAPGSGWFSGWNTNSSNSTYRTSSNTRTTSRSRPSSSSPSSSSSTRTSTSFGSTKLR